VHLQESLVESGFQLAWFLCPERETALSILTGALNKLELQHGRESRRSYWRDKHLKRSITRITRDQSDALQWLICFESEAYETAQEAERLPSLEQMLIRYIKSLVRITTAMSSFHVNVGLQRLLYYYTTEEAQRFYEALTERYLGADEYRRAKAALMQKLQQRFGSLLESSRGQHGELRFTPSEDQERWSKLLERCLALLTPWSTSGACPIPSDFAVRSSQLPPQLSIEASRSFNADRIEINRCHAFIDPTCFGRLADALALDAPFRKLALPRFNMPKDADYSGPPPAERLTNDEHEHINRLLEQESTRRRKAAPHGFRILLDGTVVATLGTEHRILKTVALLEGAELIEVFGMDSYCDLALGLCPVRYDESGAFMTTELALPTRGGALRVTVVPDREAHTAVLSVEFEPQARRALFFDRERAWLILPKFIVPALAALVLGFALGRFDAGRRPTAMTSEQSVTKSPPTPAAAPAPQTARRTELAKQELAPPLEVLLVPDELVVRSAGGAGSARVNLPQPDTLIHFRLPIAGNLKNMQFSTSLKTFMAKEDMLSESGLRASTAGDGHFVEVPVPSALLHGDEEYTFTLRARSGTRSREEVGSFTFHTISVPQR